jgi:hypothetical protein
VTAAAASWGGFAFASTGSTGSWPSPSEPTSQEVYNTMTDLLDEVLAAAGGVSIWRELQTISARVNYGGPFWELRGHPGFVGPTRVDAWVHAVRIQHRHEATGLISEFDRSADRVTITDRAGGTQVLDHPRRSLIESAWIETPWDAAQMAYFRGYATWHYLVEPFVFTLPGVLTRESEPWNEDGAIWRVLDVTFPRTIDTHNRIQKYYYDDALHLRRLDYQPEVLGFAPTAQYILEEQIVDEIIVPTSRSVHLRNADGSARRDFAMITLDISEIGFTRPE